MRIDVETKHNIGDDVFFIYENTVDYGYCNKYCWFIGNIDSYTREAKPSKIEAINIRNDGSKNVVSYLIQKHLIPELNVFNTYDIALQSCNIWNEGI